MLADGTRGRVIRRLRRLVWWSIRRLGLLPGHMPDRLGQDRELAGTSLAETVMMYFPGTCESPHQLRPWCGPIKALHEKHPVVVVFQDSLTAKIASAESGLRCPQPHAPTS
jgi:hypothetical protein